MSEPVKHVCPHCQKVFATEELVDGGRKFLPHGKALYTGKPVVGGNVAPQFRCECGKVITLLRSSP